MLERQPADASVLSREDVDQILAVTRALGAPYDLSTVLDVVTASARRLLHAERSSVWLYDAESDELVLKLATGLDNVRIPSRTGLLGACVHDRVTINVPDCYADPRFDRTMDTRTGYRTRSSLTVPLVDHTGELIGAMQLLNREGGPFEPSDIALAEALAAQCAVALARAKLTDAAMEAQKLHKELEVARLVQMSTLPAQMPQLAGYDVFGSFQPADQTGGDTFDLAMVEGRLLVLLGDAAGHGIAPALDVTRMHAMLRMAFRLGAQLDAAVMHVNNELERSLPSGRFITSFMGLLDPATHLLQFHSAGQAPLLLYRAAEDQVEVMGPSGLPLAAMPMRAAKALGDRTMRPGDVLVVLSDGIFEYENPAGEMFGRHRVEQLVRSHWHETASRICDTLQREVARFAESAPQQDDMTLVIVKRSAGGLAARSFEPAVSALAGVVAFTDEFAQRHGIGAEVLNKVHFGIEELFTNIPKYNPGSGQPVRILLAAMEGAMEVAISARDVERFDPREGPQVDIHQPIADRTPGGLGLHLIREMMDCVDYRYDGKTRVGTTTFAASARAAQDPSSR